MNSVRKLIYETTTTIYEVLQVDAKKHASGAWQKESMLHHIKKANNHLYHYIHGTKTNADGEDTLAHALTRLAMAIAVRSQKVG